MFPAGVVLTAGLAMVGQDPEPVTGPSPPVEDARFRSTADLVVLHVSVKDSHGRDVDRLPESAFAVFEERQPQPVAEFTNEDVPVTVGLVIDSSVSMEPIRAQLLAASAAFAAASHPEDEMFGVAFNEEVRSALPSYRPFTSDAHVLADALAHAITPRGKTALCDAVLAAIEYAGRGQFERRMLVVISDGGDNASEATSTDVLVKTQTSNVVIFTVTLTDPYGPGGNPKLMKQLAEETGGENFTPKNMGEVAKALEAIAHELRHSYTVAYAMPRPDEPGLRHVHVNVSSPSGQKFVVRTRGEYRVKPRVQP